MWQLESLDVLLLLLRGRFCLSGIFFIILPKNLLHNVTLRWRTGCFKNVSRKFQCLDLYLLQVKNLSWTIQVIWIFFWWWTLRNFSFIIGTRWGLIISWFYLHYGKKWYSHNAFCGPSFVLIIRLSLYDTLHHDIGSRWGAVSFIISSSYFTYCHLGKSHMQILISICTISILPRCF